MRCHGPGWSTTRRWVDSTDPSGKANDNALREILFANDPLWHDPARRVFDPRTTAWVNLDTMAELRPFLSGLAPRPSEAVKVTYPTPQRAELEVSLETPGLVVLADINYPGWKLTIDGKPAPIYRVNMLMRGAAVPAGKHLLVYSYAPFSFRAGLVVSIIGIGALMFFCVSWVRRPIEMSRSHQKNAFACASGL